jgi:uncharacterized membrane protein YvbJ
MSLTRCRECGRDISDQAYACPQCGAPFPARPSWDGWGFEYKSGATVAGWPLVHVSFKYRANRRPVVARGIVAIGQFATGLVCISQFGIGVLSLSQFTVAAFAIGQFAAAYSLIAQIGVYVGSGHGQLVFSLARLLGLP